MKKMPYANYQYHYIPMMPLGSSMDPGINWMDPGIMPVAPPEVGVGAGAFAGSPFFFHPFFHPFFPFFHPFFPFFHPFFPFFPFARPFI